MPEVFTIIFFIAWLDDRKVASRLKALSSWFNPLIFSQELPLFLHRHKMAINKKLPAGFSDGDLFFASGNIFGERM
ncbi:MAG: hypothetical protein MZV70_24765 [Desulfobacterales bacterium]|nr:hypothetical protein [Desulfobacterales bacterium]